MPLQSLQFNDFDGGQDTTSSPFSLAPDEAVLATNVQITDQGTLRRRDGRTRLDAAGHPAGVTANHLRPWYPGSAKFLMASIDGDLYRCDDLGTMTLVINGTSGSTWHMEDMQDSAGTQFLWAANGVDEPKRISTGWVVSDATDATGTDDWNTGVQFMRVWRNRMVLAYVTAGVTRRLRLSAIGNPESFGDNDFIDIKTSDDDSEGITWMEILGDNLLIFKKSGVFSLYAEPPTPAFRFLGSPGCFGRFQTCVVDGRCYFWNREGLWSTDGINAPEFEGENIRREVSGPFANWTDTEMAATRLMGTDSGRVLVAFATKMWEFMPRFRRQAESGTWKTPVVEHNYPALSLAMFRPSNKDEIVAGILEGASHEGIQTLFDGSSDDGTDFVANYHTGKKKLSDSPEKFERIRRFNVIYEGELTVEVDPSTTGEPSYSEVLPFKGDPGIATIRPEVRDKFFTFEFSGNDPWEVFGYEVMFRGGEEH